MQGALEAAQEAVADARMGRPCCCWAGPSGRGESTMAVPALKEASAYLPGDLNVRRPGRGLPPAGRAAQGFAILQELLCRTPGSPPPAHGGRRESSPAERSRWQGRNPADAGRSRSLLDENQTEGAEVLLKRVRRKGRASALSGSICAAFLKDPEKRIKPPWNSPARTAIPGSVSWPCASSSSTHERKRDSEITLASTPISPAIQEHGRLEAASCAWPTA